MIDLNEHKDRWNYAMKCRMCNELNVYAVPKRKDLIDEMDWTSFYKVCWQHNQTLTNVCIFCGQNAVMDLAGMSKMPTEDWE